MQFLKVRWKLAAVAIFLVLVVIGVLGYGLAWSAIGVSERFVRYDTGEIIQYQPQKSVWDWLELIIVPVALALGIWLLNMTAKERDWEIAHDRRRQEALEGYLDRASELVLKYTSYDFNPDTGRMQFTIHTGASLGPTITAQTAAVLHVLDGKRKGQVLLFLHNTGLISTEYGPIVDVSSVNLRGADVIPIKASEWQTNLNGWNLQALAKYSAEAKKSGTWGQSLKRAYLEGADLERAGFVLANLEEAWLGNTNLQGAFLLGANLAGADLKGADLRGAVCDRFTVWPEGFNRGARGVILIDQTGKPVEEPDEGVN